ncbi:MAG: copper amine oxidase N-terminal domain-containing protein [Clostridiales bacterium]|nr:copper amine oxidase N-terminal domain-containing protein [Clostridiales bacterium]
MKKSAVLIAAFVMASACVFSVYASSENSLNKARVVRDGAEISDVFLKIMPRDEVATGDTIILEYENAEVLSIPSFGSLQGKGSSWSSLVSQLNSDGTKTTLLSLWSKTSDNYIPWNMKKITSSEVEVELFPIPSEYCDVSIGKNGTEPYYYIPLSVKADSKTGTCDITVTIDSNETSVSSGTYLFATMPLEGTSSSDTASSSSSGTSSETETSDEETETTTEGFSDSEASLQAAGEKRIISVQIGSSTVTINGEEYTMDAAPYIQTETNSTLVPLRFVAIALFGENVENADESSIISWDAETKTASITADGDIIEFTAGSSEIRTNGEASETEYSAAAEITDGRMYIPFRALGEALGAEVSWDGETKTASYSID